MGSDKFGLDRSTIFGPEVPMSDVAQGAGLGAVIAGVKPLAVESGKFSAKYDSFVDNLFKNWAAKQKSPAVKVVPNFPGGKEMIMREGRLPGGSGSDYSGIKHVNRLKKVGPGSASGWKSILKNVWRGHKPALGKGALVGGGIAAILSALLGRKKEAASYDDMQKALTSQLQTQALRDILNVGLLGAGAAGTLRGGQGLINLLSRSGKKLPSRAGIAPLPVPYKPSFIEEDEEKEAGLFKKPKSLDPAYSSPPPPVDQKVLGLLKQIDTAQQGEKWPGAKLSPEQAAELREAFGWDHDPDEVDAAEGLMSMEDSLRREKEAMEKFAFLGDLLRKLLPRMRAGSAMRTDHLGRYNTAAMLKRHRRAKFDEAMRLRFEPTTTEQSLRQAAKQLDPGFPKGRHLQEMLKESIEKEAAINIVSPGITKKRGLWWYYPALLGAGAAGAAGGWKLIDNIMDARRRKEMDDEVAEAKGSFRDALTSQYKEGSDSELGCALDELYGKLQKQALTQGIKNMVGPNNRGTGLGMYASYAIPSSILGYLLVKGLADKGSKAKRLEKAQKQRALTQQKLRPAELYAVPAPIEEEE